MNRFFLIICMLCVSSLVFGDQLTWKEKKVLKHKRWKEKRCQKCHAQKKHQFVVVEEAVTHKCQLCGGKGLLERKRGAGWVRCKKCGGKGEVTRIKKTKKKVCAE